MKEILESIIKVIKECDSPYKVIALLIVCITIVTCIIAIT